MKSKLALCIGIDDYPGPESLNGCVNDAHAWRNILYEFFGFALTDIRLLLNKEATKKNIIDTIKKILMASKHDDIFIITISCNGSYIANTEDKSYQEVLCPYDIENNWLKLSEISALTKDFFSGGKLTIILDASFNGTVTRTLLSQSLPGIRHTDDRRARFYSPALMGRPLLDNPWRAANEKIIWNCLVIKSCSNYEYAYDLYLNGAYHGAFSYFAIESIREALAKISIEQFLKKVTYKLQKAHFPQHPQLLSNNPNIDLPLFI